MKYILLVFLLIGCTNNEDMRLFQTGLGGEGGITPPPVIIDGGELIALTPDVPLGEPTRGIGNTGLHYMKDETEARTDGKIIFWCANWGRLDWETAGGKFPSVCKLAIDYQVGGGGPSDRYTAELLEEILTFDLADSSMQGLFVRNDGRIYFHDAGTKGIEPYPDANGKAILVNSSIGNIGSAIGYDSDADIIVSGNGLVVEKYDFSGNSLGVLSVDLGGITAIDHITINNDEDIMVITGGASICRYYTYSTLAFIKEEDLSGRSIDIESAWLVRIPYDGHLYLYVNSDNWIHQDGNPDTDINAIHKVLSNVFD